MSHSILMPRAVENEHYLARHASLSKQLLRLSCLGKTKSLRDEWLDLVLLEKIEESHQVPSKLRRPQSLEPLNAEENNTFPARQQHAADDVQSENTELPIAIANT